MAMSELGVSRRLAAILAADVAGYSRLMGADEAGTLERLRHCRRIIDDLIAAHRGRLVGSAGDSVLAEFQSSVDAIRCALGIQGALGDFNAPLPDNVRMQYRIGINLGDVLVDGSQIYGDGVNVAARLEGLAEPGGIAVSASIHEQVHGKVDCVFDDVGLHHVKNIAEPVRAFDVRQTEDRTRRKWHRAYRSRLAGWQWAALGALFVLFAELGLYGLWKVREVPWSGARPASDSLAVLPLPAALTAGTIFRSCKLCPEMIVVPAGTFSMGAAEADLGRTSIEGPRHEVRLARAFAVGRYETTFTEWDACAAAGGCDHMPEDRGWGRGNRPVIYVSWHDAQAYVAWLSRLTGQNYRLPSEAEWEYATRAGSDTVYWWGDDAGHDRANCGGCGRGGDTTLPVGSFAANPFGLYDIHGNVWEWTLDCWNGSYAGAPTDGSAWLAGDCDQRVVRGGAWGIEPAELRAAHRRGDHTTLRSGKRGFRVALSLP